jgi:hypothetical protein
MDTLFQEVAQRTSSPWEDSGANTPALAAEVDASGNVEYKVRLHLFMNSAKICLVEFGELLTGPNPSFSDSTAMAIS